MINRLIASCLSFSILCFGEAIAAESRWQPSPFEGEEKRAAIGCSDHATDEAWACIAVRCEDDGTIGLYAEIDGGGNGAGRWTLDVDGRGWEVYGDTGARAGLYTAHLLVAPDDLLVSLKKGRIALLDKRLQMADGFEIISLKGASQQIDRVLSACSRRLDANAKN